MKNSIKFIPALLFGFMIFFSSCENWLDVSPKSQVKDSELFSSQGGYKEALAGVYSTLVIDTLYTKEMRFGMLAILAHEWASYSTTTYPEAIDYDYTNDYPKNRIELIWNDMYNAIVNANVLLELIDGDKSLFTGNNYSIIKGEALALRAFCHFELLRCFGVSYAVDKDKPSIPYVTLYVPMQSKQLAVSEVAAKVIADLEIAARLLEVDPIYTREVITEFNDNGYLINRQLHLNYYAVKGLMARVYLWMEEYGEAAACAQEVIDSNVFSWVTQTDMISGIDPSGAVEQLWGIDANNLSTTKSKFFTEGDYFSLDVETYNAYYPDDTDYRYIYLFQLSETNTRAYFPKKFNGNSTTAYYNNKMSMIKLAEMYYILAEGRYRTSGDWLKPLNDVRTARGLPGFTEVTDFYATLVDEFSKEFIAEGQLWFLYKRLNIANIYGAEADLVETKAYTFPLPESELKAADRENNR